MPESNYSTLVADYGADSRELFAPEPTPRSVGPVVEICTERSTHDSAGQARLIVRMSVI